MRSARCSSRKGIHVDMQILKYEVLRNATSDLVTVAILCIDSSICRQVLFNYRDLIFFFLTNIVCWIDYAPPLRRYMSPQLVCCDTIAALSWDEGTIQIVLEYKEFFHGPPHFCLALPEQFWLHSPSATFAVGCLKAFPQRQALPFWTP